MITALTIAAGVLAWLIIGLALGTLIGRIIRAGQGR
jgi:hypothetical protein